MVGGRLAAEKCGQRCERSRALLQLGKVGRRFGSTLAARSVLQYDVESISSADRLFDGRGLRR